MQSIVYFIIGFFSIGPSEPAYSPIDYSLVVILLGLFHTLSKS